MTKRDFFRILIKLFGLYAAILSIFSFLPSFIGHVAYEFNLVLILLAIGSVLIIFLILLALIFGADKIIDFLKLDKGYDDGRIDLGNIKGYVILKLAVIVIGGLLIIDNFPIFLNHSYLAFKHQVSTQRVDHMFQPFAYEQVDYFQLAVSAISIVMGYLMITNYTNVANWLSRADKKNRD